MTSRRRHSMPRWVDPYRSIAIVAATCATVILAGCMTVNCNVKDACRSAAVPATAGVATER